MLHPLRSTKLWGCPSCSHPQPARCRLLGCCAGSPTFLEDELWFSRRDLSSSRTGKRLQLPPTDAKEHKHSGHKYPSALEEPSCCQQLVSSLQTPEQAPSLSPAALPLSLASLGFLSHSWGSPCVLREVMQPWQCSKREDLPCTKSCCFGEATFASPAIGGLSRACSHPAEPGTCRSTKV